MVSLHLGDCLEILPTLPDASVDCIIADPPYGNTACKWDSVIPLDDLWAECKRVIKPRGGIVLFGSFPFAGSLWASNPDWFKYELIWNKKIPAGMSYARFQPMRQHETILIFGDGRITYNPQLVERSSPIKEGGKKKSESAPIKYFSHMGGKIYTHKQPVSIIDVLKVRQGALHPTQKPVALLEYLIKTYTNEGDTVLDFCFGSGTTGVACIRTGRNFIGMEKDKEYYSLAQRRLEAEAATLPLFAEVA